jgi:hypothetical protein
MKAETAFEVCKGNIGLTVDELTVASKDLIKVELCLRAQYVMRGNDELFILLRLKIQNLVLCHPQSS